MQLSWSEHMICNLGGVGSTPSAPTRKALDNSKAFLVYVSLKAIRSNPGKHP